MPTKITNTNTNINRININVPRRYTPRPTKKNVAKAEQELSQVENLDREIPYVSQAPSQFINPSVFGFNTTPIQEPVRPQTISRGTQTEPMETQTEEEFVTSPRVAVAEAIDTSNFRSQRGDTPRDPIPFRSSSTPEERNVLSLGYSEPQYKLNIPSDFPTRLSQASGSSFPQSGSAFKMPVYANRMRDIQKQGRPDINEMAIKVKEAYRGEEQTVPYAKTGGTPFEEPFGISPTSFQDQPLEVALPPATKPTRGRPVGSKSKPKDPDAPKKQRKVKQVVDIGDEGAFATAGKGGLRGKAEEID
jgi:hypothetical protein